MLRNHLRIAYRNTIKHGGYSAINLFGLAVSIACFTIIMLYIHDELSYDKSHNDSDRIYRVMAERLNPDGSRTGIARARFALIPAMLREIPGVEQGTHFFPLPSWGKAKLSNSSATYYDDKMLYVDRAFFDLFSFSFIQGDAASALIDQSSIVLTESLARRFFGSESALGKTLIFSRNKARNEPLLVSGVIEDVPSQSHFSFDFVVPMYSFVTSDETWANGLFAHSYFKISPGASLTDIEAKIQQLVDANDRENIDGFSVYYVQPMAGMNGIHLSSKLLDELQPNSDILYIRMLLLVAVIVLAVAGINYVNLVTARSALRSKEIGVRKAVGALRNDLMSQFLSESLIMLMSAGLVAIGLTEIALHSFNSVMQKQLSLFAAASQPVWILMTTVVLAIGLIAGMYPALLLSSFKPVSALKSTKTESGRRFGLVSFTTGQRTKEIGIRKVLGASVTSVVKLLSKEYVKLVLIANIVAWPIAYWAMNKWLTSFAYRIDISWWIFALAGGLALVIALLSVSAQALRAALANPVESLRYE